MTVHLIKLAVGIEDVGHLAAVQERRLRHAGRLQHVTRNTPRRSVELVDGGSLYWVIRGTIRVRQAVIAVEPGNRADGRPACALVLDPRLVPVAPRPCKAFQGWRYLEGSAAPADLAAAGDGLGDLPPEMASELKELGLL